MEESKMRVLDAEVLMPEYRELLKCGAVLPLKVSGGSMLPFLAPGRDSVYLKAIDRSPARGDIAMYQRPSGQYVLHRVLRCENGSCWFAGDAQDEIEGPLPESCVFAFAESVIRKGKKEAPGSFVWDFFAGVWLKCIGKRKRLMGTYSEFKAFFRSK